MLNTEDNILLKEKGMSEQDIQQQIGCFKKGFPFLKLKATASIANGILAVNNDSEERYIQLWNAYCKSGKHVMKFVPASGAASRMFKDLFEFLDASYVVPTSSIEKNFFEHIASFAFYSDLDNVCLENNGKSIKSLIKQDDYKAIVENLLLDRGLNYGNLPKGLLKFHHYSSVDRTPVEEHLVEGQLYAVDTEGCVNIHFTVSPEHHELFCNTIEQKKADYESGLNVKYNITFSEQKPKTDTIAASTQNEPFRENGKLVFRPGGHGALIENLNDLDSDIVFIKNIDNVILDDYKTTEARYKKILAGILVSTQKKAFDFLTLIDSGSYTHEQLLDILNFVQQTLFVKNPETKYLEDGELVLYLKSKLNRPFRVCGMVKNVGEPGGGPFLAFNSDGTISPQILESSQINMNDTEMKNMFEKGTHFNPVDIVCGVKDYLGNKFDLKQYVDSNTGFISIKSKGGKELKALELPGLWNGAMSDWNTLFVEVPIDTFNPVKTVADLLRKEHQGI